MKENSRKRANASQTGASITALRTTIMASRSMMQRAVMLLSLRRCCFQGGRP